MPRYFPIDAGVRFECARSDLRKIYWDVNELTAEFLLPNDETHAIQVHFVGSTIVRLLDEMPLSTEHHPSLDEGRVPNHFAYRVEGAVFAETQSTVFREGPPRATHYQFVTGCGCMDVLSSAEPAFAVVNVT